MQQNPIPAFRAVLMVWQTLGNCAIAVGANEKHSTTWDMLRSVAETLIATCIGSPGSRAVGGTVTGQTTRNQRRSHFLGRRKTGKGPFR